MKRLLRRFGLAIASSLLPAQLLGQCLPPGAPFQVLEHESAHPPMNNTAGAVSEPTGFPAQVFADASGSMRGFTEPASAAFSTIYRFLPSILSDLGSTITLYRVGDRVDPAPLLTQSFELATSPVFYCPPKGKSDRGHISPGSSSSDYYSSRCAGSYAQFNLESRIDLAMEQIAHAPPATLAVIITDLFVSSGHELDQDIAAFRATAGDMLRGGRAMEIIAVPAAYHGYIFDLPDYPNSANSGPLHNGTRPLVLLIIGPPRRVNAFHQALTQELNGAGAEWQYSSFGLGRPHIRDVSSVVPDVDMKPKQFIDDELDRKDKTLQKAIDGLPSGARFPIMALPPPASPRWTAIEANIPLPKGITGADAPQGQIALGPTETFMFRRHDGAICGGTWERVWLHPERDGQLASLRQDKTTGEWTIHLFENPALLRLFEEVNDGGDYFVHRITLRLLPDPEATGTGPQGLGDIWVRRYGFQPGDEVDVLQSLMDKSGGFIRGVDGTSLPRRTIGLFPALNLPALVATLRRVENDIRQENQPHPVSLGYFVLMWRPVRY